MISSWSIRRSGGERPCGNGCLSPSMTSSGRWRRKRIVLFGSVARGDEGPDSDLDLLVVLDHIEPAERAHLISSVRRAISARAPIDVFVTDLAEYERRKDVIGSMLYWPAREGQVVYERAS